MSSHPRNNNRASGLRSPAVPIYRGPQASAPMYGPGAFITQSPTAALLIDFDNVTMGIRSDLATELRNLLSSDFIRGKVQLQRAYADWRRYPQYVVPLAEASIEMVMAPAYGSSKKNATDIRLAVDAMELIFTRPEIGTYILLSGDSDFSSLVIKLKEYGKYVIGVGIRESSSDLLVQNCDEYYSYNSLAGLVKSGEREEAAAPHDPWDLVVEAVNRMKRNGDVMRSDRLKQVMQEIDSSFDEKDLGMAKFSRFCQEAAQRGLITLTRLENGQMEIGVPQAAPAAEAPHVATAPAREPGTEPSRRRGRGRGRSRGEREERRPASTGATTGATAPAGATEAPAGVPEHFAPPIGQPVAATGAPAEMRGERLSRSEALDLVARAAASLSPSPEIAVPAHEVRQAAHTLLGRDSDTLSERNFHRILRDAHDAGLIDLRKHGDEYVVAPATPAPLVDVVEEAPEPAPEAPSQAARAAANAAALRRGIRQRGRGRGPSEIPPELLAVGIVEATPDVPDVAEAAPAEAPPQPEPAATRRGGRGRGAKKTTARGGARKRSTRAVDASADGASAPEPVAAPAAAPAVERTTPAAKRPRRPRARKAATRSSEGEG